MIYLRVDEIDLPVKKKLAGILHDGGVGVWKTDTVYGYFGRYDYSETVKRISRLKGRSSFHYFSMAFEEIQPYFEWFDLGPAQEEMLEYLLPGAFTFVLPLKKRYFRVAHDNSRFLGVRVPNHILTRELCGFSKTPLISTSANYTGLEDARNVFDIPGYKAGELDFVIDSGTIDSPVASSVIKLLKDEYHFLRVGAISEDEFKTTWDQYRKE